MSNFRRWSDWLVYAPLVALLVLIFNLRVEGDTNALIAGAQNARLCMAEGVIPCNRNVVHFAIFQYLFALPALAAGLAPAAVGKVLAGISLGFAIMAIGVFVRVGRAMGGIAGAHLALALLFSGYALFYFFTSFNEIGAFALFAAFCAAVVLRWNWIVLGVLALLCAVTKEIAPPFVLFAYLAARVARDGPRATWESWRAVVVDGLPVLAGVAMGVAMNAAFNWFRFGMWVNKGTLNPDFQAPASAVTAYFSYLFISPAGGLLYVWLSLAVLAFAAIVASRKFDDDLVAIALALAIVFIANLGLAFWWSSFGWYAWGPRLTLPFLGATAVLLLFRSPRLLNILRARGAGYIGPVLLFTVLFLSMIPNALMVAAPGEFFPYMFAPGTMNKLLGPDASNLAKSGPEVIKMVSLDTLGRIVIIPSSLRAAGHHPMVVALVAIYAGLASWRICRSEP